MITAQEARQLHIETLAAHERLYQEQKRKALPKCFEAIRRVAPTALCCYLPTEFDELREADKKEILETLKQSGFKNIPSDRKGWTRVSWE